MDGYGCKFTGCLCIGKRNRGKGVKSFGYGFMGWLHRNGLRKRYGAAAGKMTDRPGARKKTKGQVLQRTWPAAGIPSCYPL